MRYFLAFAIVAVELAGSASARAESAGEVYGTRSANNSVYLEALGLGLIYSVNYDRVIADDFTLRAGVGLVLGTATSSSGKTTTEPVLLTIPITVNYIGAGSRWTMLEVGAGLDMLHVAANVKTIYVQKKDSTLTVPALTALIGIRYQPPAGGLTLRAGVSLLESKYGFFPLWPYASAGFAF